jgi:hypothetical protein
VKIHLDMDGLVANCMDAICVRHGKPTPYTGHYWATTEWNMSPYDLWKKCEGFSFWSHMDKTEEADEIINLLTGLDWRFLTASPRTLPFGHDAWSGKSMWVERNYPEHYHRLTVVTGEKSWYARKDELLIDDFDHNVNEWKRVGPAILFPRPWNSNRDVVDGMTYLKRCLREYL